MTDAFKRLLLSASPSIEPVLNKQCFVLDEWDGAGEELTQLLSMRNGFYAYDSALLVRPLTRMLTPLGLMEWNVPSLWISAYGDMAVDTLFFAEDIFGEQFCLKKTGGVYRFNPESGESEKLCDSLDEWSTSVTTDSAFMTGSSHAVDWALSHGPIHPGARLMPNRPFVLGGEYAISNLHIQEDVKSMRWRARLATQIRDLPDGAKVILEREP